MNGLEHLARLMLSANVEVQSNACGCVTNLAILDENKIKIANSAVLPRLIKLAVSPDLRVQRNAAGALLNLTHAGACDHRTDALPRPPTPHPRAPQPWSAQ